MLRKKNVLKWAIIVIALNISWSVEAGRIGVTRDVARIVQERVSVRVEDLPEAVKNAIRNGMYEGWKITDAYKVTKDDQSQFFELTIAKGEESSKLKLDKNGQTID